MDNVTTLNTGANGLIGPPLNPNYHHVIIEGRIIPNLLISITNEEYFIYFDGRFGYSFPDRYSAHNACALAAQVMAIEQGYPSLNAPNKDHPFAPIITYIGE